MNRRRIKRRRRDGLWNSLSCAVVFLFVLVACLVTYIFANPQSKLNPFPPPAETATVVLPTIDQTLEQGRTLTALAGSATETAKPTNTQVPTATAEISATVTATPEPTLPNSSHNPATTPIPTKVLDDPFPFVLQGQPKFLDASTFDKKHSCGWLGVAGQTFDLLNRPLPGILVQVSGTLGGEKLEMISMSGTVLTYGDAGYEIFLSNNPTTSQGSLSIRLIDENGKPLSEQIKIDTSSACRQNLTVVNFKKVK